MENQVSQSNLSLKTLESKHLQKLIGQSSSSNGYEREAAVIAIGQLRTPPLIPTLIRRVNDWVANVSIRASYAIIDLLKTEHQNFIIDALPEIMRLATCNRRDHSRFIATVIDFLLSKNQHASLINAILHKNQKVSTIAFRLCRDHNLIPKNQLLLLAIKSSNIAVVRAAAGHINEIDGEEFLALAQQLIWHKCNAIASRAIKRLSILAPDEIERLSLDLIFNRDAEIRKIARQHLTLQGADSLTIYRQWLNNPSTPIWKQRIALIGTCEIAGEKSVDDLILATTSTEPSLRSLAISLLVDVNENIARSIAITGLFDESPKVVRISAKAFLKKGFQLSAEELLHLTYEGQSPNRLEVAMFLAKKGNKWENLIFLLELQLKNRASADAIQLAYFQWHSNYNRRQTQPTPAQLKRINSLHSRRPPMIDDKTLGSLTAILEMF